MDSFVVPPPLSLGLGRGLFTGLYQASVRLVPGCGALRFCTPTLLPRPLDRSIILEHIDKDTRPANSGVEALVPPTGVLKEKSRRDPCIIYFFRVMFAQYIDAMTLLARGDKSCYPCTYTCTCTCTCTYVRCTFITVALDAIRRKPTSHM